MALWPVVQYLNFGFSKHRNPNLSLNLFDSVRLIRELVLVYRTFPTHRLRVTYLSNVRVRVHASATYSHYHAWLHERAILRSDGKNCTSWINYYSKNIFTQLVLPSSVVEKHNHLHMTCFDYLCQLEPFLRTLGIPSYSWHTTTTNSVGSTFSAFKPVIAM